MGKKQPTDFPLTLRGDGRYCKKIDGKRHYFGTDREQALRRYRELIGEAPATPEAKAKPATPLPPGSPFFVHQNGQLAKKVRGRMRYFGPATDHAAALAKWLDQKDYLLAGRLPPVKGDGVTIRFLLNHFLTNREAKVQLGKMAQRSYKNLKDACDVIAATFDLDRLVDGLQPEDFRALYAKFAETHGPVSLFHDVARVRSVFNYGKDVFKVEPHYGQDFDPPDEKALRAAKEAKQSREFSAAQIHKLYGLAGVHVGAMILLGINCGFGNDDCATLPLSRLDLDAGWHDHGRPKTGIRRRCPLWPETVAALRASLAERPKPKDDAHADLVFVTKYGGPWQAPSSGGPISREFGKLMAEAKLAQEGRGFYSLRHCFQTVADETGLATAVRFLMGHAPKKTDMSANYNKRIADKMLLVVTNHVRAWYLSRTASLPGQEWEPIASDAAAG